MNQISKIMARFIPLMDLSMLLLGCFLIALTAAKFDSVTNAKEKETASVIARSVAEHTCVMLYVACEDKDGRQNGQIYSLDKDYNISQTPISQSSPEDIDALIGEILPKNRKREDAVVFILSEKYAWDESVPRDLCLNLKASWNLPRIYRVKGVDFDSTTSEAK